MDTSTRLPGVPESVVAATVRMAISDPGKYVPRDSVFDIQEPLPSWQARAVLVALAKSNMQVRWSSGND